MQTIKQKTIAATIIVGNAERTITIRRMAWKPARIFTRDLAALLSTTTVPAEGDRIAALATALPELVAKSEGLIEHVLLHSSDLQPAELEILDLGTLLELVRLAVGLNLDAEVKNSFAGIVATVVGEVPAARKPDSIPTT